MTAAGPTRRAVALVLLGVLVVAGGLRLWRLGEPGRIQFDETYYVEDARQHLERGVEEERSAHPPAGTWALAAGINVAGDDPVGWRLVPALAGTLTAVATAALGLRLLRRAAPAALAGLLVALDGIAFTLSRLGMLDATLGLLVVLGALALALDRDADDRRWRHVAGALLGLGVATKWSGALALLVAIGLVAVDDRSLRRVIVPLVAVPAAAYLLAWSAWLVAYPSTETAAERCGAGECGSSVLDRAAGLVVEHREMAAFHLRLEPAHPDRSPAWAWPVQARPVLTYLERCPRSDGQPCAVAEGNRARTLTLGNPVLWAAALVAVPLAAWLAVRRRDPMAGLVAAFALGQWAPWLLTKPGYAFYLVPAVPFAALAVALSLDRLPVRWRAPVVASTAVAAVAAFAFWYPVLSGVETSADAQADRLWFDAWR